ncbi:hypothetical protein EDD21DRAFT_412849 [Dissophora ornata]|nr:hypothetical protein BGZ58_003427 [Dissophora ornata]KAI8603652.1 hypothetical protein EDD21DRAFT_412849 [Dissophora ornata]
MKFTLFTICVSLSVLLISSSSVMAAPIAITVSEPKLVPCPGAWNSLASHNFVYQSVDKRSEAELPECPETWNPMFGHGFHCKPVESAQKGGNSNLMPCPKNWNPKYGHGPACHHTSDHATEE